MNLEDCYRLLELKPGASLLEIKASYRRLARQYHPDTNPGAPSAQEKFIALTEGYQTLLRMASSAQANGEVLESTKTAQPPHTKVTCQEQPSQNLPPLSPLEQQLKWNSYQKLQQLWKHQRFLAALSLVESLAQRLPQDPEVHSWQASTYHRWASQLIDQKQADKARIYLKKALKTDPHNRSLWSKVERDFRRLEKIF